jgi:hypothetical protein
MTSKISLAAVIALAAIFAVPTAASAASHKHKGAPSGETGYTNTNPGGCLGGGCTYENPDRVRQPCSGGSCYKRTHSNKHKSSAIIFVTIRAG